MAKETLTRRRFAASTVVNYRQVTGAYTDTSFEGSLQTLKSSEREQLPEGFRNSDTRKLYTTTEIRTSDPRDGVAADHVLDPDGVVYVAIQSERYRTHQPHYRVFLARLTERT